ncbi:helix-turn-helix domain-containing protein [Streptomyces chiangmaiensis]|uniref:Pyridoxamine 5'-phosphate oxidase family protein n=1 Tax=Streptomyces chiangmaiensis TaxID=766497 RepID=A0ABU7FCJ6_9ACTN|nr:pyridoxamine 5'-phosphate oxidase family protein [Streptomyces chiangmaiensis]MED7821773.1 pyridoxamine 5'-phosphate oxidase family protein [Streptomyces chiangmaiensis]
MAPRESSGAVAGHPAGNLGRRIALRREELGLSLEETANRAGMASSYLQYLEAQPTAAPGVSTLLRLAGALETTVLELTGGDVDLPPGLGQAGRHPTFTDLTSQECRDLLSTHGVGRLALPTDTGPEIIPLNYSVVGGSIVYRTVPDTVPSQAAGAQVAFEVDRIDAAFSQGWSVLVRGRADTVTDPDDVQRLEEQAFSTPWAGGQRDLWMRIDPDTITGRRITVT